MAEHELISERPYQHKLDWPITVVSSSKYMPYPMDNFEDYHHNCFTVSPKLELSKVLKIMTHLNFR
jgi:hypothetical protein